jgi:hypothetical protein
VKLSVLWSPKAEASLAALWADAPQRKLIEQAANTIDAILREQAANVGESRGDGTSILFVPPLGV